MKTFYADDTYCKSDKSDKTNRIHLFGGILISKSDEKRLLQIISNAKSKYTHPNLPMKWNFKDTVIKDKFQEFGRIDEYKAMLADSNSWRKEIIKNSLELDYKIVCGIIESFSDDTKSAKKSKPEFLKYSFENLLMRVGIDAMNKDYETYVIVDWPPDGNPQPLVQAYYRLFHQGKSSAGTLAKCGKLSDCNFFHSLLFAKCNHSPLLQFSDLIIGSIKDYLEAKLSKRQNLFATEIFELYKRKIRFGNGTMLGYGIIPPSGNKAFREKIKKILEE
ncbi:hypothetical protein FLA105534_04926 [Flavobacterium bizetiae]|uniref:DUF3800 domain-containing protein n=1 Tax=Flavobacterium bizetiae TaxID=2704140 RepID=A0A6J4GWP8_9FLAO|nr:DUF3800 domain-containing protein [Flavobacterium bizetiae]CAA9203744.1 hypothetical protein FLA105534_04926 [Flavobacterium bizetiae]CAD5343026.1 hypothetical protein FLA105535_03024 [Flavobacterium bizetiae]CAD5350443.1 hypothetical protein FLA105534_04433 [Flavobacterium bizetiae]